MVVKYEVKFENNPHGTYYSGQILKGTVNITSDKPKHVRAIALKIRGFANVKWSEMHTVCVSTGQITTTAQTSIDYCGHEDFIKTTTYLLGSKDSHSKVAIEPGKYSYNFTCAIPANCPSSFEGAHGHIRYLVRVVLIRPWKFDQKFTKGFTVVKKSDLNLNAIVLKKPSNREVEKTFSWGPFRSKPLKMKIHLPQTGFVPGQKIPVSLLVTNDSRVPVQELKVELVMLVEYKSQTPSKKTKHQRTVATKIKRDSVPDHCKKLFQYNILVPPTPPTCVKECAIMKITYELQVHAKVKGMHTDLVLHKPITIGNVPLPAAIKNKKKTASNKASKQPKKQNSNGKGAAGPKEVAATTSAQAARDQHENDVALQKAIEASCSEAMGELSITDNASLPPPWPADEELPPPSYEEAVHVPSAKFKEDDEHDYGQAEFAPRYPVFDIESPAMPTAEELEQCFKSDEAKHNDDQ